MSTCGAGEVGDVVGDLKDAVSSASLGVDDTLPADAIRHCSFLDCRWREWIGRHGTRPSRVLRQAQDRGGQLGPEELGAGEVGDVVGDLKDAVSSASLGVDDTLPADSHFDRERIP
jgi:uncharacterized protein YjbJ (UPF0337 family)